MEEFDEKYAISKEAFTKMLDSKMKYYDRIIPKLNKIETHQMGFEEGFYRFLHVHFAKLSFRWAMPIALRLRPYRALKLIITSSQGDAQGYYILPFSGL